MYNLFITYWTIGVVYVIIFQLVSFIYKKARGDKYIYDETTPPFIIVVFMNLLLTLLYPLFTVLLMVSTLNDSQKRKEFNMYMEDVQKKLNAIKDKHKENSDESN